MSAKSISRARINTMNNLKGDLRAFSAWWKVTPYKGKKRSVRTLSEYLRVLNHYIAAHPDGEYTLTAAREWVASEMERAESAGRWAARALKAYDGWRVSEYNGTPPVMDRLEVPADPTATNIYVAQPDDITAMLSTCKTRGYDFIALRDAAIIHCLRSTGMRIGELCSLNMEDINTETGVVTVKQSKNGEMRRTRLDEDAQSALRRYRHGMTLDKYPHVWESSLGGKMRPHSIQKRITARAVEAGCPQVTPHSFRRGMAQEVFRRGGSQTYLVALCGWKSDEMPRRYLKSVSADEALAMHERLFG